MAGQEKGVVNIRGKQYHTVAKRVNDFRNDEKFKDYSIVTNVQMIDDIKLIVSASIMDTECRVLATGHAEEFRQSGNINRTSALENCETSAIGRALACFGIGGEEFASANEVQVAIAQQEVASPAQVAAINQYIEQGLISADQLSASFGHADPSRLFTVEADRVINAVVTALQQQEKV